MNSRMERKNAVQIDELICQFLKANGLAPGHNTYRIFEAWDNASGAAKYTMRKFFRNGKLYITLNNSVVRAQLFFQKEELVEKMNSLLGQDPMFIRDDSRVGLVKELILK